MKQILDLPDAWDGKVWAGVPAHDMGGIFHRHDELEMNLVLQGRAGYLLGDRRYDLHSHTLVWLFPGQEHTLLDVSPDYRMWIAVFKPALLQRLCQTSSTQTLLETDPQGHFCRQLPPAAAGELGRLLAMLARSTHDRMLYNAGLGYALLMAWATYGEGAANLAGRAVHPSVARAVHLLREENTPLALPELARHAGLNPSRLGKLFHEQVGLSIVEFRNRLRIERFLQLFGNGQQRTLHDAARRAGFGSYAQFHRVFKHQMGYGPADHRQRIVDIATIEAG
jgi:AraC-like DNA-binding protein